MYIIYMRVFLYNIYLSYRYTMMQTCIIKKKHIVFQASFSRCGGHQKVSKLRGFSMAPSSVSPWPIGAPRTPPVTTWWLISLSKWVMTPDGISRVNPLITGVIKPTY